MHSINICRYNFLYIPTYYLPHQSFNFSMIFFSLSPCLSHSLPLSCIYIYKKKNIIKCDVRANFYEDISFAQRDGRTIILNTQQIACVFKNHFKLSFNYADFTKINEMLIFFSFLSRNVQLYDKKKSELLCFLFKLKYGLFTYEYKYTIT